MSLCGGLLGPKPAPLALGRERSSRLSRRGRNGGRPGVSRRERDRERRKGMQDSFPESVAGRSPPSGSVVQTPVPGRYGGGVVHFASILLRSASASARYCFQASRSFWVSRATALSRGAGFFYEPVLVANSLGCAAEPPLSGFRSCSSVPRSQNRVGFEIGASHERDRTDAGMVMNPPPTRMTDVQEGLSNTVVVGERPPIPQDDGGVVVVRAHRQHPGRGQHLPCLQPQ